VICTEYLMNPSQAMNQEGPKTADYSAANHYEGGHGEPL
jgi:hypothetical protein